MEQSGEWSARLARDIGRRVARYRERVVDASGKRMTAQQLADRTAALGHPLDRSVIAKLEKGHRQTITVADLLVLAKALGVHPVLLMFPLGEERETEVLPGRLVPTWDAARWVGGRGGYPGDDAQGSSLVDLLTIHDGLIANWGRESTRLRVLNQVGDDAYTSEQAQARERLRRLERQIRECRQSLQGVGVTAASLPDLPSGLAWLDTLTDDEWAAFSADETSETLGDRWS